MAVKRVVLLVMIAEEEDEGENYLRITGIFRFRLDRQAGSFALYTMCFCVIA